MSHKKMLQCSMGALLLLLPWFGGLVLGEISKDFSQCLDFFYKETPPAGIPAEGYQPICQRYQNQYRFASLYHREHRSPLYSAYILSPPDGKRPKSTWMFEPQVSRTQEFRPKVDWMFEPQLAYPTNGSDEMQDPIHTPVDQNLKESQAMDEDYRESIFTRGHLNPIMHQKIEQDREATFTLTNIVPQQKGSNSGPWEKLEDKVLKQFKKYCNGTMYVITGVMPYKPDNPDQHLMKHRVSVPEYMWSAYCCTSLKSKLDTPDRNAFPTYAAVGRNDHNSTNEFVNGTISKKGYDVKRMSLEDLQDILRQRLGGGTITLFHDQCKQ